jgi:hypothetical protein
VSSMAKTAPKYGHATARGKAWVLWADTPNPPGKDGFIAAVIERWGK